MSTYVLADNIISPLGTTTEENFDAIKQGKSGITHIHSSVLSEQPFYGAKINYTIENKEGYTFLESLFIHSIEHILQQVKVDINKTVLVLSSTKGNIDVLGDESMKERVKLSEMARAVNNYFDFPDEPVLISNACISGVSAILTARNLIEMGEFDHAIVCGGDLLTKFTLSGFQCLKAVSENVCKPYDKNRDGINLGEGVGTVLVSRDRDLAPRSSAKCEILGGGQSNDANHISGPSRTGEGLKLAITKAVAEAGLTAKDVDYINAHGTATLFNDEMESIAIEALELDKVPLNSLKGYFGHTLGGAGIIESILTIRQMNSGKLLPSAGFNEQGVSGNLNVLMQTKEAEIGHALKTVSGFGGCNAAVVFKKI